MLENNSNDIIAKFMGVDIECSPSVYRASKGVLRHLIDNRRKCDGLLFDKSWDWLMPVVENIEQLTGVSVYMGFSVIISDKHSCIYCYEPLKVKGVIYQTPSGIDEPDKLTAVYNAIIYFIEWYNSQP